MLHHSDAPVSNALSNLLILTEIFSHLTCQHHIYACTLVSRSFFTTTIAILWRHPRIYKHRHFTLFASVLAQSQPNPQATPITLRPYATYVHDLDIGHLITLITLNPSSLTLAFSHLPVLRFIDLRRCYLLNDDLLIHLARHCPFLCRLWLKHNPLTEIGALTAFTYMRELENLHVEDSTSWCTDAVMAHILISCPNLAYLNILGCTRITGISLAAVRNSRLKGLRCRHVGATSGNVIHEIMRCPTLEEVDFGSGIAVGRNDIMVMVEGSLRAIKEARIETEEARKEGRNGTLRRLEDDERSVLEGSRIHRLCLNLGEESTDEELLTALGTYGSTGGGRLRDLELRFWGPNVTERSLRGIADMCFQGLRKLRLERWFAGANGDAALAQVLERCTGIEVLHLSECSFMGAALDAIAEHCAGRIVELRIEKMEVSEEALVRAVRASKGLKQLHLQYCRLSDAPLRELSGNRLKKLSFVCDELGAEGWAAVCGGGCPWLEVLELGTITDVPRESLYLISNLRHLETFKCYDVSAYDSSLLFQLALWLPSLRSLVVCHADEWFINDLNKGIATDEQLGWDDPWDPIWGGNRNYREFERKWLVTGMPLVIVVRENEFTSLTSY